MLYLDTSLIVAVASFERESEKVERWLERQPEESFATSDWCVTEFSAALSIKLRRKVMTSDQRDAALAYFDTRLLTAFERLDVLPRDFRTAASLADRFAIGLRGGDALHLAVATRVNATLCTLDKGQAAAGAALDIRTLLVSGD